MNPFLFGHYKRNLPMLEPDILIFILIDHFNSSKGHCSHSFIRHYMTICFWRCATSMSFSFPRICWNCADQVLPSQHSRLCCILSVSDSLSVHQAISDFLLQETVKIQISYRVFLHLHPQNPQQLFKGLIPHVLPFYRHAQQFLTLFFKWYQSRITVYGWNGNISSMLLLIFLAPSVKNTSLFCSSPLKTRNASIAFIAFFMPHAVRAYVSCPYWI